MRTFADWLPYYNDLDVAPGLEALDKMRAFYTDKGIDILKDAASIPGVSLHYLLWGSIERGAELYSPSKDAYNMLKAAVVGGQSLVFTRYHEEGVTKIRSHRFPGPKLCKRIIVYDANALYLATMLREMPCGEEKIVHYPNPAEAAKNLTERLKAGTWFGFAEVDIAVSQWAKFEEMPPFFYNKQVPAEAVPQHMKDYLVRTGRTRGDGKKLIGALSSQKLLLYAPLLRWYVEHGAVIKAVYRAIDYQPTKIFTWFVEQVTEARRTGDIDKSKVLLAEVFKLLGNSGYGKLLEALERQTCVVFTKDEKVVDRALRSAYFCNLEELGEAYELESRKSRITINRPFQIGIANICFLVWSHFGHTSHKLAPRVNLQHLWPRQRAAPVNRLKSFRNFTSVFRCQRLSFFVAAGDVDNSESVFVIRQKKKVRLVDRIRRRYVEFWTRNIARRGEIDLPKSLFDQPLLGCFFRDFCSFC